MARTCAPATMHMYRLYITTFKHPVPSLSHHNIDTKTCIWSHLVWMLYSLSQLKHDNNSQIHKLLYNLGIMHEINVFITTLLLVFIIIFDVMHIVNENNISQQFIKSKQILTLWCTCLKICWHYNKPDSYVGISWTPPKNPKSQPCKINILSLN